MTDAKRRDKEEVGAYEHVGKDRTNLPTDETALALDAEVVADKTVSLEVETTLGSLGTAAGTTTRFP